MKAVISKLIKDPVTFIFLGIYVIAILIRQTKNGSSAFETLFTFLLFFCIFPLIMYFLSRNTSRNTIMIRNKTNELKLVILYFVFWLLIFMLFGKQILADQFLSNGLGFWGLLVIIPLVYLLSTGYRMSDFGITTKFFLQNLKVTFLACIIICCVLLFLTPGGKFILDNDLSMKTLIISFMISIGFALVFAALFEEFFFRGILQTRLTQYFNSEIKGILIASIIFGLYHLPFEFYKEGVAQGDLIYALSNVCTEQMFTAPMLGILWARTRNLMAPVILHTFIDTISFLPQVVDKYF